MKWCLRFSNQKMDQQSESNLDSALPVLRTQIMLLGIPQWSCFSPYVKKFWKEWNIMGTSLKEGNWREYCIQDRCSIPSLSSCWAIWRWVSNSKSCNQEEENAFKDQRIKTDFSPHDVSLMSTTYVYIVGAQSYSKSANKRWQQLTW